MLTWDEVIQEVMQAPMGEAPQEQEPWRYGYVQSSAPGLRPPSADYGEDYLTPVLRQYPGINSAAISEMAQIPVYEKNLGSGRGAQIWEPTLMEKIQGKPYRMEINVPHSAPENRVPYALHEYGHGLSIPRYGRSYSWENAGGWEEFSQAYMESDEARRINGMSDFRGNASPMEAYADIPRVAGGRLEKIPPELRRFYWWLR